MGPQKEPRLHEEFRADKKGGKRSLVKPSRYQVLKSPSSGQLVDFRKSIQTFENPGAMANQEKERRLSMCKFQD